LQSTHASASTLDSFTPLSLARNMVSQASSQEAFAPVLAAMATMREGQREQKKAAHEYLEQFQKSVSMMM
jgi:hypothetical protein